MLWGMGYACRTFAAMMAGAMALQGCFLSGAGLGTEDGSTAPMDASPLLDATFSQDDGGSLLTDGGEGDDAAIDAAQPGDDGGTVDAGATGDAGLSVDAGPPDAGPPDAGPPDAGPPDAGPPDAGPRPCAEIYDSPDRFVCVERDTECEMYVDLAATTGNCSAFCAAYGGTAIRCYREAEPDDPNCGYLNGETRSCSVDHNDEICVCSRFP